MSSSYPEQEIPSYLFFFFFSFSLTSSLLTQL